MKRLLAAAGLCLAALGTAWAFSHGAPSAVGFVFGPVSGSCSSELAKVATDIPAPGESQDPEAEIAGDIQDSFPKAKIEDVKCWLEGADGKPITTATGGCPFSELKTGSSATSLETAERATDSGGCATFNLAAPISPGQVASYSAQLDGCDVPDHFKVCMQSSTEKATGDGNHYAIVNSCFFTLADPDQSTDGMAPSIHDGVEFEVTNSQGGNNALLWLRTTLVSNDPALTITAGEVRGDDGNVIPGTSASITNSGKKIVITGLSVTTGQTVTVWLDLNHAYTADTNFNVHAGYTTFNPGGY